MSGSATSESPARLLVAIVCAREQEERYIAVGFSNRQRALLVVHCENKIGTVIRIISARKPTRAEKAQVFGGKRE